MFYDCDSDHDLDKLDPDTLESYIQELENPGTVSLEPPKTVHDGLSHQTSQESIHPASDKSSKCIRSRETARKGSAFKGLKPHMSKARSQLNTENHAQNARLDSHDRQLILARSSLRPTLDDDSNSSDPKSNQELSQSQSEDNSDPEQTTQPVIDASVLNRKWRNNGSTLPFNTPMNSDILKQKRCQICHQTGHVSGGVETNYILCKKCRLFLKHALQDQRKSRYRCSANGTCQVEEPRFGETPCSGCRLKKAVQTGFVLPKNHSYLTQVEESCTETKEFICGNSLNFSTPMSSEMLKQKRCQICLGNRKVTGGTKKNYILCQKCLIFLKKVIEKPRRNASKCPTNGNCQVEKPGYGEMLCGRCRLKKAVQTGLILPEGHPYLIHNDDGPMDKELPEGNSVSQESCAPAAEEVAVDACTEADDVLEMDCTDSDTVIDESRASTVASKSSISTVLDEPVVSRSLMPSVVDHQEDYESAEYFIDDMFLNDQDVLIQQAILDSCRKPTVSRFQPKHAELSQELDEFGLPKNIQDLFNKWFYDDCSQIAPRSSPIKDIRDEITFGQPIEEKIIVCNQISVLEPKCTLLTEDLGEADPSDEIKSLNIGIHASKELEIQEINYKNSEHNREANYLERAQIASHDSPQLFIEMKVSRTIIDRRPANLKSLRDSRALANNQSQTSHSSESVIAPGEDCDESDDDCDPMEFVQS